MFSIEEIRTFFVGFFFFLFAGYIIRSEQSIMALSQDGLAKIVLIGSLIGAVIYYFRERNDEESSENPKSKTSTVKRNEAKCNDSGLNTLISRQRALPCIKIKLNDRTFDEIQLPKNIIGGGSPTMVSPTSPKNESEIEQDLDTSCYTPQKGAKSLETALFTLDPATEWSDESGTPIAFKRYKSSANLDTLFENPVEEEEEVSSGSTSANKSKSVDWVEAVDMELDTNLSANLSIDRNGANTSKKSVNVSVDSHDIVDMDIDEEDIRNEFLKTLELTPLTLDFDNMDISKSTDLNSTCDNDIPKPAIISNVEMLSDLFQESFKFETSLDSCAEVSLNKELSMSNELNARKCADDVENGAKHTSGNRSDSAIGSEIAEEEDVTPLNNMDVYHFSFGHPKKESHAIASKPASHTTGSSFTTALDIHPNHQFNFNSSKIPVMKELEYRRTHLRPIPKHE